MNEKISSNEKLLLLLEKIDNTLEKLFPAQFPEYMNTKQAAEYIGVSFQYLEIGRHKGCGPPYIALGGKKGAIRYRKPDLDAWMEEHRKTHKN